MSANPPKKCSKKTDTKPKEVAKPADKPRVKPKPKSKPNSENGNAVHDVDDITTTIGGISLDDSDTGSSLAGSAGDPTLPSNGGCRKSHDTLLSDVTNVYPVQFRMNNRIREIELKNIVDPRLEKLDPYPDAQVLFKEYDERYFGGLLNNNGVVLDWSDLLRCTAGYYCEVKRLIRLSKPLLLTNLRSDLVDTLLHEMCHAFVDLKIHEEAAHGPQWYRITNELRQITGSPLEATHSLTVRNTWVKTLYACYHTKAIPSKKTAQK